MVFVAIIFNARIAFVPLLVSLLYLIFLKKKKKHDILSFVLVVLIVFFIARGVLNMFPQLNNGWGLSFFYELSSFMTGEGDNTLGTLTGSMWVVPQNAFDLLFGTGENLFHTAGRNSDVGYIIQLNYGGLVLLSMILFYFFYVSRRIIRRLSIHHWFPVVFVFSIFVLNFKGFYLAAIPGNRFLTLLYVYYIYTSRKGIDERAPYHIIPVL